MNTTPEIEVYCRTCRRMLIYTDDAARARSAATQHHRTAPGHWLQATTENLTTHQITTIDIPNREKPQ